MSEIAGQPLVHTPTPGLPEFDYVKLTSLAAASQFLAEHAGEARPFMGGTDVFVRMRDGFFMERSLVDVKGLDGMNDITFDPATGLKIGASVNMNQIIASPEVSEHYPLLAEAAHTVASYQLRARATVVGNICNASPAGDTIGACLVLDGTLRIHGVGGEREESLSKFFVGPGQTNLEAGDITTAITFPVLPKGCKAKYVKLGRNAIGDLAIVGVTALGYPDESALSGYRFRLALASVAPVPLIPAQAETILADRPVNETTIAEAAEAAMEACTPIDDVRGSARYRKLMVRNLTRRAITEIWEQIRGQ